MNKAMWRNKPAHGLTHKDVGGRPSGMQTYATRILGGRIPVMGLLIPNEVSDFNDRL